MAITCPSCGMENADAAAECRRCRAPFNEAAEDPSTSLGVICQRCEAYNEPGVARCTTCGYKLGADPAPKAAPKPAAPAAQVEPVTPPSTSEVMTTISEELKALAITPEEAADAGLQVTNGAGAAPPPAPSPQRASPGLARPSLPRGWAAVDAAMGVPSTLDLVDLAVGSAGEAQPQAAPHKVCSSCAAQNAPAAKFCSECGTPFGKRATKPEQPKVASAPAIPADIADTPADALPEEDVFEQPAPAEEVPPAEVPAAEAPDAWAASTDPTARPAHAANPETSPINLQDPSPEPLGWDEPGGGSDSAKEVTVDAEGVAEALGEVAEHIADPLAEEAVPVVQASPPYQASLVVERGAGPGTTYLLSDIENIVGSGGASIELPDDPHLAPRHAALVFDDQKLLLRDEAAANGVYVKVRESAPIQPGDHFVAGERLLRFDGPCELPIGEPGETPYLGSPRPQGMVVRVTEILRGGKTGRTCFRAAPVLAIGRSGCDLNFPSDPLLGQRHAELRIDPDGSATLVDLNAAPSGVFLRLRPEESVELQTGDVIQVGDQVLRLEVG